MSLNLVKYVQSAVFAELDEIKGMKTLLMDSETTNILSLTCPQSSIMKKEVYLFQDINNLTPGVSNIDPKLRHLKCVVVLRNVEENIQKLIKELIYPSYQSYYFLFVNRVDARVIKRIAEADVNEVIKTFKEIAIDFEAILDNVFLLKTSSFTDQKYLKRCSEGLASSMVAFNMSFSSSCIMYPSSMSVECEKLASQLKSAIANDYDDEFRQSSSKTEPGIVLLLDRRYDPLTPLMTHWSYLALIHELIGFKNNKIEVEAEEGKRQQMTLSADQDDFYRRNLFSNYGELGFTVKGLVDEYQKHVHGSKSNIDSIGDIKEFITKYPEFKKMSGTVSKHVSVVTNISNKIQVRNLMKISSLEQDIACSNVGKGDIMNRLKELVEDTSISKEDIFRVLLIALLKFKDVSIISQIHADVDRKDILALNSYLGNGKKYEVIQKESRQFAVVGQNLIHEFKSIENSYDQYQPPLKEILSGIISGKTSHLNLKNYGQYSPCKNIIVFFVGGITCAEIAAVYDFNKSQGSKVIIGGTNLLNSEMFIKDLKQLAKIY